VPGGGPEVLLVRRTPAARFMPGVWVFPGGAVGPGDGGPAEAAARELAEEAGLQAEVAALVPWSRWITPEASPIRFDTWFYLAPAPPGGAVRIDGEEVVDHAWLAPAAALEAHAHGRIELSFPTARHLEELTGAPSAAALLAAARTRTIAPVLPRMDGGRVLLPGDPDYDRVPED
jgi:8-oxo-dGTP pyrophosphatase MutT (NUDIX family)